ncbi:MAG: LacI family DNA-binding transcriptional regulator [Ilumatobacteraceae bacterium]
MSDARIKDVAAMAGVSIGTVSNVLNRPERVRAATRSRVEGAIAELGFVPNGSARQLRDGRSRIVAYVVLDAANPFFMDVAQGVDETIRDKGLSLFLCNSNQDSEREDAYLADLAELRARGVLITAVDPSNPRLELLRRRGTSIVLVDRVLENRDSGEWCAVGVDDVAGGDLAVEHLIERGHVRIGFIGGPITIPQVRDRHVGAGRAMKRAGLAANALTVIPTIDLTVAAGLKAGEKLLGMSTRRRPTAVFCANDLIAVGLLQQLTQQGVAVPDDIAIIGYDDIEYAAAAAVPLSSVAQPRHELGQAAARLLIEEAEQGPAHTHRQVVFTPELVARASTAVHR